MAFLKKTHTAEKDGHVFIDLSSVEADDGSDKKVKVLRIHDVDDLVQVKAYLTKRISVVADLSGYGGDRAIPETIIRDAARECAGYASKVNEDTWLAVPFDVLVDDTE